MYTWLTTYKDRLTTLNGYMLISNGYTWQYIMATQQNSLSDYFSTTQKRDRELSTSNSDSGTPFRKSTKISRSPVDKGKVSFSSTVEPDSVMDNGNDINDTEHKSGWEKKLFEKMCAISDEITVGFERLEAKFNATPS